MPLLHCEILRKSPLFTLPCLSVPPLRPRSLAHALLRGAEGSGPGGARSQAGAGCQSGGTGGRRAGPGGGAAGCSVECHRGVKNSGKGYGRGLATLQGWVRRDGH